MEYGVSAATHPLSHPASYAGYDEDIMEDDEDDVEESSNTQTDFTRWVTWRLDRAIQMPFLREK